MATTRIKDVSKTTTDLASDEYIIADGATNGTQKMARDDAYADWAAAYVAAPTTYKLAPLNSGTNKIDATYLPTGADTAKGAWDANANSPTLIDGTGTAGDYYDVTVAGSQDLGSGSIAYTVGDVVKYDGATWYKIDSVSNVLDGSATAADGRTTLEVDSSDDLAESTGTKLVGPSLSFDGSSSYLEVGDDAKLSFTDSVNDLPFTVSGWIKMTDATSCPICAKYSTSASIREWYFTTSSSDKLRLVVIDTSANSTVIESDSALTTYEGQWIHVAVTYGGAGPSAGSGAAFTANMSGGNAAVYINGVSVAVTATDNASYTGMSDTSAPFWVGRQNTQYANGEIRQTTIHNRELSAAEVETLFRAGQLGDSDQYAGALGGAYSSDFTSDSQDGWTGTNGTIDATTSVGGEADNIQLTLDTSDTFHSLRLITGTGVTIGKRYRIEFDYYIPSGNNVVTGVRFQDGTTFQEPDAAGTQDAWTRKSIEYVADNDDLRVYAADGSESSIQDVAGTDTFAIRDVKVTQIGTLCDFRAESYDNSTGKLYDISDNAFVATNNGASLVGREVPVYETGTWTPTMTFGGGSTGMTYSNQEGYYTRIGNTVYISCGLVLSAKGSSTGAAKITGLPFTGRNVTLASYSIDVGWATSMASLASVPTGLFGDNTTDISLYDWSAAGASSIDDTNFTDTSGIRFSGTYQIQ